MPVTLSGAVRVDHLPLRQALAATRVHAGTARGRGEPNAFHRVRLVIDQNHVNVVAASGTTMAAARVPILTDTRPKPETPDDGDYLVDLTPADVENILKVFSAKRQAKDADPQQAQLELRFDMDDFTIESAPGGLWTGHTLGVALTEPNADFPPVLAELGRAVRERGTTEVAKPLVVGSAILKVFEVAGRTYSQPVRMSGSGPVGTPTWLVEVGEAFVGSFGSRPGDDLSRKAYASQTQQWARTLPDAGSDVPLPFAAPDDADDDDPGEES